MTEETKVCVLLHLSNLALMGDEWAIAWLRRINDANDDAVWSEFQAEVEKILAVFNQANEDLIATAVEAGKGMMDGIAKGLSLND